MFVLSVESSGPEKVLIEGVYTSEKNAMDASARLHFETHQLMRIGHRECTVTNRVCSLRNFVIDEFEYSTVSGYMHMGCKEYSFDEVADNEIYSPPLENWLNFTYILINDISDKIVLEIYKTTDEAVEDVKGDPNLTKSALVGCMTDNSKQYYVQGWREIIA